jgi:phosphopantothenoylcysteine synthetase/decarboxylase
MAAAVADYRPPAISPVKIKKRASSWTLDLEPTVDILAALRADGISDGVYVVGFAAETDDLLANALVKLRAKRLDLIVVNDVSRTDIAMGAADNEVTVIDDRGVVDVIAKAPKHDIAVAILRIVQLRMS